MKPATSHMVSWAQLQFLLAASRHESGTVAESTWHGEKKKLSDLKLLESAGYLTQYRPGAWDQYLVYYRITDSGRRFAELNRNMKPPRPTPNQLAVLRAARQDPRGFVFIPWGDGGKYRSAWSLEERGDLRWLIHETRGFRMTRQGRKLLDGLDGILFADMEPEVPTLYFEHWWRSREFITPEDGGREAVVYREGSYIQIELIEERAESIGEHFTHLRIQGQRESDPILEIGSLTEWAMQPEDAARAAALTIAKYTDIIPAGFTPLPESLAPVFAYDFTANRNNRYF